MAGTALVTGASGFTGPYVVEALRARGYEVHGVVQGEGGSGDFVHRVDLRDQPAITALVARVRPQCVIHLAADHPDRDWKATDGLLHQVDLGFCFGDACVSIEGYPICLFAPSGVAQAVAYEAIQAEMAAREER